MRINQNAQPDGNADDRAEKQKDEPQRAQRTAPKIREEKSLRAFAETLRSKPTTSCFSDEICDNVRCSMQLLVP